MVIVCTRSGKDLLWPKVCCRKTATFQNGQTNCIKNSLEATDTHKMANDRKAKVDGLKEGDYAYSDNQLFLGKK
jgi:hypothetical protein